MPKKRRTETPVPPRRTELSDDPIQYCGEISRLFRAKMRERDGQEGAMTQPGAHLIRSTLAIQDGIRQQELVRYTHLRAPTVSAALRRMEDEGQVERRGDPEDQRAVRVYLTPKGREMDRLHIEEIKKLVTVALAGLSSEEIEALMTLLPRIRDNLLSRPQTDREQGQGDKA